MLPIGVFYTVYGTIMLFNPNEKYKKYLKYNAIANLCTGLYNIIVFIISLFIGKNNFLFVTSTLSVIICIFVCLHNINKLKEINESEDVMKVLTKEV